MPISAKPDPIHYRAQKLVNLKESHIQWNMLVSRVAEGIQSTEV